ncbi:hypothetical protein NONO_c07050 [Nocardia nova SH22a]|uniref:DUF3027 domain-containing protein n=1 Tax=Nocardia nova SH22a TaxID=1415166 RepID=W5T958_9NOCA|nr:hypothetical protein NONO_c07050 [Nocardia nova SH22a]
MSVSESGVRPILAEAVGLARRALLELQPTGVGEHLGVTGEDECAATHRFAATLPGYRGWQWEVVVAAAPDAEYATVSESALLPGPDALVAPEFVPWDRRVRPGDLAPGDLLAPRVDDERLVPGYLQTGDPVADEVCEDVGLGRRQVLSREGRFEAAERWYSEFGPDTDMARSAPAACGVCGFFVPLAGAMRAAFGVCANAMGADGRVVHVRYGCGAHSDTEMPSGAGSPLYEAYDDAAVELIPAADLAPREARLQGEAIGDIAESVASDRAAENAPEPGAEARSGVSETDHEAAAETAPVADAAVPESVPSADAARSGAEVAVAEEGSATEAVSDAVVSESVSPDEAVTSGVEVADAEEGSAATVSETGVVADADVSEGTSSAAVDDASRGTGESETAEEVTGTESDRVPDPVEPAAEDSSVGAPEGVSADDADAAGRSPVGSADAAAVQADPTGPDAGQEAEGSARDSADSAGASAETSTESVAQQGVSDPAYSDAWAVSSVRVRRGASGAAEH